MTIGLGIFLAGIVIGLAILLLNPQTRKLLGFGLGFLLVIVAIGGAGIYFYNKQNDPLTKVPETNPKLLGFKSGDSRLDIVYKLGEPSKKIDNWEYFSDEKLAVKFEGGFAKLILYKCAGLGSEVDLNGIKCGSPASKIQERFKDKAIEYCILGTPTERVYLVPDFNSMYVLKQDSVFLMSIRPGSHSMPDTFISCKAAKYFD